MMKIDMRDEIDSAAFLEKVLDHEDPHEGYLIDPADHGLDFVPGKVFDFDPMVADIIRVRARMLTIHGSWGSQFPGFTIIEFERVHSEDPTKTEVLRCTGAGIEVVSDC